MFICMCNKKSNNYLDSMHINCSNCNYFFTQNVPGKIKQAQIYCKSYDFICNSVDTIYYILNSFQIIHQKLKPIIN